MATPYELIYNTGVPGRDENVWLILEEAGVQYKDTQSLSFDKARKNVVTWLAGGGHGNPPYFTPPLFKHGDLVISQTPNILLYLGPKLGLAGSRENDLYRVNALALTALDLLSNERVLENEEPGPGPWLLGDIFTYAELVLFQLYSVLPLPKVAPVLISLLTLDGTHYAFPKAMKQAREAGKYDKVFKLYEDVKARPNISGYLASDRRQKYQDWGVYQHYDDNDVVAE
ncbi:uncharacterized protein EAE98_001331 [Botrytis deweyae]|uniref:GST N-terminal domain-containing protein n=1 Tax=Botrytis deweyae TaxID=2478750 RepID=A0ABQ7J172_9HELO|nr:uncharacterized protein EAE98_001331 [Botrytis deweyae]KAF7938995.1 hypothetical protein EAE98_001331 [Botrytis deweyae]